MMCLKIKPNLIHTLKKNTCPQFVYNTMSIKNISGSKIDRLVRTKMGIIKGSRATDGDYFAFLGIPYATVDKKNPFGASLPHKKFEDVFEACDDSALSPQLDGDTKTIAGTLDCLQLNVFVPNFTKSRYLLPVLVFIHGGFFQKGSFSRLIYGPKFLVRHGIIVVTINYRLGPYGFMCLETSDFPGNQGLKDQIKALKWIKDNIEAFGGDPDRVTLSGQSAGGAAVDFHLMYPGKRLFNKVILQSGVALTPARIMEPDNTKPLKLAEHLGFKTSDLKDALIFLAKIDPKLIIETTLKLSLSFRACIEKKITGVDVFILQHPVNANRPHVENVPVLIGTVDREMSPIYVKKNPVFFQNFFKDELTKIFDSSDNFNAVHEHVRNFYVGDQEISDDNKGRVIDFASDFTYCHPVQRAIRKYIQNKADSIYFYVFNYDGGRNISKYKKDVNAPGAGHCDELGYLFDVSYMKEEPSLDDQVVIDRMTTIWANFVKYGNPTPSISGLLPLMWSPVTSSEWNCLRIGRELTLGGRPFHDRMVFWDLFYELYGKLEKGVK